MTRLTSSLSPAADAFRTNAAFNQSLAAQLRTRTATAALGGPEASRVRHAGRGKLLPRERVERPPQA